MSWAAVRSALKARLEAIPGIGQVASRVRYLKDGPDTATFRDAFVKTGVLNHWQITRTGRKSRQLDGDSDLRKVQHEVQITLFYALSDPISSEDSFQDLLDSVCLDLEHGDRTLDGAVKSHSVPQADQIALVSFYLIDCHSATVRLTIEEHA